MRGIVIPFADLLIGGTALHYGYGLMTRNLRHFEKIPGLKIVKLKGLRTSDYGLGG